jgi:hypothetical protein
MATTRTVLRQRLSEALGDYWSSTTTGSGDSVTLVDTDLRRLFGSNDEPAGWWILMTSGAASGEVRRVKFSSGYTASSGTAIVSDDFSASTGSGSTYEIHRISPEQKNNAINRAAELLFTRGLYLPVVDETLVVDDLLLNGNMETFSGGFTSWATFGSPTVTAETSRVIQGSSAAKIVAAGSDEGIEQNRFAAININEHVNKTLHFQGHVFAAAANAARLRVTFDGSTFTSSSYHGGSDEWEGPSSMYVQVSIPTDATELTFTLDVANGNTAYFDDLRAWIGGHKIRRYTIPTTFRRGPNYVLYQANNNETYGTYAPLHRRPPQGSRLRLVGSNVLSRPSTEAGTMEVEDDAIELIVARAAQYLCQMLSGNPLSNTAEIYRGEEAKWNAAVERILATGGVLPARMGSELPTEWYIEEDGEARYLVLDKSRFGR